MENIIAIVIGIICIALGISNRKGNVSSLHSYHRKRISEENVLPFGKLVGFGMMVIGFSLIVFGALCALSQAIQNNLCFIIANVVLILGLVVGLGVSFFAMIKYNKGIF